MSAITDYIKAHRPSVVGLWDFGAMTSGFIVPELTGGLAVEQFDATLGTWTRNTATSFLGQPLGASTTAGQGAQIMTQAVPGSETYANIALPFTYEIMLQLASTAGTQDFIGPGGNSNAGMCLRLTAGHFNLVKNYISVPVVGTETPDTSWHILAGTADTIGNTILYLDGAQDGAAGGAIGAANSALNFNVMWCNHANPVAVGSVGYVAVYNTALSAAALLDNFQKAQGGVPPSGGSGSFREQFASDYGAEFASSF